MKNIRLIGVKQNNLKSINVTIPLGSFTTICGPSGSGKSSLAFETLYAEGQRRYIESLSNYSRQFLNKAPKPDVDSIENIPPAISIEQKNGVRSSRSTVGTTTEVLDYLRLLYEKIGVAHCPDHKLPLEKDSPVSSAQKLMTLWSGKRGYILAPIFANTRRFKGKKLLLQLIGDGFIRILVPQKIRKVASKKKIKKNTKTSNKRSNWSPPVTASPLDERRGEVPTRSFSDLHRPKAYFSTRRREATRKTTKPIDKGRAVTKRIVQNDEPLPYSKEKMGKILELETFKTTKRSLPKEDFYIVIDRLGFSEESRLADSISQAFTTTMKYNQECHYAQAKALTTDELTIRLDERYSCSACEYNFPEIDSRLFSFNSPLGACEACKGFGNILTIDSQKVIPNPQLSLYDGAIKPFSMPSAHRDKKSMMNYCNSHKVNVHTPWEELPQKIRNTLWQGNKEFSGVIGFFKKLEKKKYKMHVRIFLSRHKSPFPCDVCNGTRLKSESQQVLVGGKSITELTAMSIEELYQFVTSLHLTEEHESLCKEIYRQMSSRLYFLNQVGLGYITLDRPTATLSGGEYQRIMLSNQLGVELSQTLYVLDEPTIGLHPRDNERLIETLHALKKLGNTLVVVEHDQDVIKNSSHIIEMGPGSGHLGGNIIFYGEQKDFYNSTESNTVEYLIPNKSIRTPYTPRPTNIKNYRYALQLKGCTGNNLRNVNLSIPLNRFVTMTGVSGSGKSSLISQTLYPIIARDLKIDYKNSLPYKSIDGVKYLNNVLFIDQSPIGTSARSHPVTYLKVFDHIRTVMAQSNEARRRGYTPGTFSINVDGGRCPVCKGLGFEVIDMMFMDDIHVPCDSCGGSRYRNEILEITYKHKNIFDILNMTVAEAMNFFISYPNIRRPLAILKEVGLDYLKLGQPANTLSGGESQRLKIAREFNSTQQKGTLYILDEPTTGLHFKEVHLLIKVLNRLIEGGGSILVIEHNLEIICHSDHIIDVGPEAGCKGGRIIAQGDLQTIMRSKKSYTGRYLQDYMKSLLPNK